MGDKFIDEIDRLIRHGPLLRDRKNVPPGQPLEFGDVRKLIADDPHFNPPALFITATNVTGRKLEVFSSIDACYDRVPIVKAVRASAGFPAFFRPIEFQDARYAGWYADGGIVSNYPAWIFSKEFRVRLIDSSDYRQLATRPWVHFGLRLERSPITTEPGTTNPKLYVSSLARLVLGGEARTDLEERLEGLVIRSFTIQSPANKLLPPEESDIKVPDNFLDIDAISAPLVREMYRLGKEESLTPGRLSYTLPQSEVIEPLLGKLIERAQLLFSQNNNEKLLLRSTVFIPSQDALHIRYALNMAPPAAGTERDPTSNNDYDLFLPLDAGLTGACMSTRRSLICNLQALGNLPQEVLNGQFGMPAELHDKVGKDRTWLASVPIFDPLATYPRELSIPTRQELPHPTAFLYGLAGRMDGSSWRVEPGRLPRI